MRPSILEPGVSWFWSAPCGLRFPSRLGRLQPSYRPSPRHYLKEWEQGRPPPQTPPPRRPGPGDPAQGLAAWGIWAPTCSGGGVPDWPQASLTTLGAAQRQRQPQAQGQAERRPGQHRATAPRALGLRSPLARSGAAGRAAVQSGLGPRPRRPRPGARSPRAETHRLRGGAHTGDPLRPDPPHSAPKHQRMGRHAAFLYGCEAVGSILPLSPGTRGAGSHHAAIPSTTTQYS